MVQLLWSFEGQDDLCAERYDFFISTAITLTANSLDFKQFTVFKWFFIGGFIAFLFKT